MPERLVVYSSSGRLFHVWLDGKLRVAPADGLGNLPEEDKQDVRTFADVFRRRLEHLAPRGPQ